jgi:site-specific DNA recombinase
MMRDVRAGRVDVIVAWAVDRLTRKPREIEDLIDLGIPILTVSADLDLATDQGRAFARVLGAMSRAEVERKSARQKRANVDKATAGRPWGGHRPFGYDSDRIHLEPTEAAMIRDGYSQVLAGASIRSVARAWASTGITTTRGKEWQVYAVRTCLLNARNAGIRSYRGELLSDDVPAQWEAIVTPDVYRAFTHLLSDPARRTTPGNSRRYLLSGLALCYDCQAKVTTGRTQHGVRTYRCPTQAHVSRAAEPCDLWIRELVIARLSRKDARDLLVDRERPDVDALRDEDLALRGRLNDASALFAGGEITARQLADISRDIETRLEALGERLYTSSRSDVLADAIKDPGPAWDKADVGKQRAIIQALMQSITLHRPGRGRRAFDPATVTVVELES